MRPPRDGGGDLRTNGRLGDGPLGSRRKHEIVKSLRREHPLSTLLKLMGDAAFHLLLPRGEPSLRQAGGRAAGHSGDMREISVQIRIPARCRRAAQGDRRPHRLKRCSMSCARRGCCAGPAGAGSTAPTWAGSASPPRTCWPATSRRRAR